jgi:branched-chain amino acid aminotransferase
LATYYINGEFVPADQACLPVNDLAILRGFAVFELLRTYGGRPFFLEAHVSRLEDSARHIGLAFPWSHAQLIDIVRRTLARNDFSEANIRIVVTGGPSDDFVTPANRPRLLVLVSPIPHLPAEWYTDGVKIVTAVVERPITGAKSINYIPATMAMAEARRQGAIEAVYVSRQELIQEGTTSNVFVFTDQSLVTPGKDILQGITRRVILDLAASRFPVEIRDLSRPELYQAREVFITGTNKGLVPVVQVDDRTIGDGRPGPRTIVLMRALEERTMQFATQIAES